MNDLEATTRVLIIPLSQDSIKDLYSKEIEYLIKLKPFKDFSFGFFAENGPEAIRKRSIFAEVFKFDSLKLLVSDIRDITRANFSHLA
jgi:cytochrome P450